MLEHILRITFGISVTVLPRNCGFSSKSQTEANRREGAHNTELEGHVTPPTRRNAANGNNKSRLNQA